MNYGQSSYHQSNQAPYQSNQQPRQQSYPQAYQQAYQPITATFSSATSDPHYKGYEQAVIEHAKMLQVQQAKEKIFGVPSARKPFVGQWAKRKGPPKEPVDPRKFFCEVCNVTCAGQQSFDEHMVGKSHKHKEALKTGKRRLDLNRPGFHCEVCNATCSSKEAFSAHINGSKHNRAIKTLQMLGKPIPEYLLQQMPKGDPMQNLPVKKKVVGVSATKFVGGLELSTTHGNEVEDSNEKESESSGFQPIGEEFLEVVGTTGRTTSYRCKICECNIGDNASRDLHVRGRRHRLSYKQKIDPSIRAEERLLVRGGGYAPVKTPVPRPSKTNRSIVSKLNQLRFAYNSSILPDTTNFDAHDEQFVHLRLEQIHPNFEFMDKIEELVEMIERGLKKVSDVLIGTADEVETRLLRGVVRVGPLGEKILSNFDKRVDVVLLCKDIPSVSLLQKIVSELPNHIAEEELRERTIIEILVDESAFSVRFKDFAVSCVVTLTSVLLRSVNENGSGDKSNASAAEEPSKAKPADALAEGPCLRALAALRHTKFFQAQCATVINLSEVVQLLRDISHRIDTWSVLTLYLIQLLAFKAISSHPAPLRVSDGLRRFFEMLSGGTFMSENSKLLDPCEKEDVNALVGMSAQQRENLVCSAQHGLRLITYDQINTILGMERDSINRKRPINEADDNENEAKKPKQDSSATAVPSKPQ